MRLSEALTILKKNLANEADPFRVFLVCGFTPLHLQTFLLAHLQLALPQRRIEVQLQYRLYPFGARLAKNPSVKIVNSQWLDRISPPRDRVDMKSEVLNGFPYKLLHADHVAELLSRLIHSPSPKKGLITDLDNT